MSTVYDPFELSPEIRASNALFLDRLDRNYYDFVDLGTCDGGGFEIARLLGAQRGLGFDLAPRFVEQGLARGLDVACMDVRALRGRAQVDFAVCSHILEHIPNLYDIGSIMNALSKICRDYILICGPCFDEEEYLYGLNVKVLHSAMTDHLCKFKTADLASLLYNLRLRDFTIGVTERIRDTDNIWVHNAAEPVPAQGLWTYDRDKHLPKPSLSFDRDIYRDFVCVVALRAGIDTQAILAKFRWGCEKVVLRSSWSY